MNSKKAKLIAAVIFLIIVIGGGYLLSTRIQKHSIRKTGVKTEFNPVYIDSMVRAKNKK